MKLQRFEVESYMTLHENNCRYNLADTCAKPLTLKELLAFEKKDSLGDLMNLSLDYGAIEGSHALKKGILDLYQSGDNEEIAICHGGVNANELVLMTLLSANDHILSFLPTYQQLYSFPESLGVEVDFIHLKEENDWKINFEELEKNIKENTKMICLNLPNNPTGTTLNHEEMQQLIQICKKHDLYVLVDEIYRGLYQEESMSDLYEKGIATSGLSKVLSTAGLRIGWIKTKDKELIRLINERRDYSIISSGPINDYLGALTLKYSKEILTRNREILEENKNYLKKWLKDHPHFSCVIPKYGTVCFLKYDYQIDSNTFCETLQEETGVFFVPGCCFDVENHLRFGLANDPQLVKEGLEVFSNWLKKLDTSR